jgi:hypothetical protein
MFHLEPSPRSIEEIARASKSLDTADRSLARAALCVATAKQSLARVTQASH